MFSFLRENGLMDKHDEPLQMHFSRRRDEFGGMPDGKLTPQGVARSVMGRVMDGAPAVENGEKTVAPKGPRQNYHLNF
jgi:hypothetical protein